LLLAQAPAELVQRDTQFNLENVWESQTSWSHLRRDQNGV